MALTVHRAARPGLHRPLSDINVTPLVDVMLVLLVVFMVTAPMLAAGLKVNLPQANTARPLPPADPVVVTVTRDGTVALGTDLVEREHLVGLVKARLDGDPKRVVRVRGDREASYGAVVEVIDLLAAGGITRLALVSRSRPVAAAETNGAEPREVPPSAAADPVAETAKTETGSAGR